MIIIFIGLLIFAIIFAMFLYRETSNWSPNYSPTTKSGIIYHKKEVASKRSWYLLLGIHSDIKFKFIIKRESFSEKVYKALKLATEKDPNHSEFSKKYFLMSDQQQVADEVFSNLELQNAVEQIFSEEAAFIESSNGLFQIRFKRNKKPNEEKVVTALEIIHRALSKLLIENNISGRTFRSDVGFIKSSIIISAITSLLITSLITAGFLAATSLQRYADFEGFMYYSLRRAAEIFIILFIIIDLIMRKSSYCARVLNSYFFIGLLSVFISTPVYAYYLNTNVVDTKRSEYFVADATAKNVYSKRSRKGRETKQYKLTVTTNNKNLPPIIEFQVSADTYNSITPPAKVIIGSHVGILGFSFMEEPKLAK